MSDKITIFTKTIRLKNGRILYASQYGLKAFPIQVDRDKNQPDLFDPPANENGSKQKKPGG